MALVLADRVRETTTVVGTGTATLLGAVVGYQSFTAVGDTNTTYYVIANQSANEWEVGIGTYTASGTTLSRDTVLSSSNAGALVSFSAGTKDIWVDYAAGKAVTTDTLAFPPAIGGTTPNAGTFTTLTATGQTSLGGAAGSESLRVTSNPSATSWVEISGSAGGIPSIKAEAVGASAELRLSSKSGSNVSIWTNNVAQRQFQVSHTASAVNYVQVTGGATGSNPVISVQGSDANRALNLVSKGTGFFNFYSQSGSNFQFRIDSTAVSVNYPQVAGSVTGQGVLFSAQGSDTNISQVFQSKGTGAIDLAAGSSGVNISNGGTVTAITRTATGANYTSIPTLTISVPTTAGGVQATSAARMFATGSTVVTGGTGYTLNDVVTLSGGTPVSASATYTVTGVSGGVVTAVTPLNYAIYSALPSNPVSVTGGTGVGLTLTVTWNVQDFTITNAGSGYVEQPTVTFSGGGGSGAAAYASVGVGTVIRSLGSTGIQSLDFYTPSSTSGGVPALRIRDTTNDSYSMLQGGIGFTAIIAQGNAGSSMNIASNGSGLLTLNTNGTSLIRQMAVAHTASAVNYVQVTGAATGGATVISAQGSDSNVGLAIRPKGSSPLYIETAGAIDVRIQPNGIRSLSISSLANAVNYGAWTNAPAGSAPSLAVAGTDTNIGLNLTSKGAGELNLSTGSTNPLSLVVQDDVTAAPTPTSIYVINASSGLGRAAIRSSKALYFASASTNSIVFLTNGSKTAEGSSQFQVTNTTSAVNYVQVTGAATGGRPTISAQGSDASIGLSFTSKGASRVAAFFNNNATSSFQFSVGLAGVTNAVNYLNVNGVAASSSPELTAEGTDTNLDIRLTPKGTGNVRFGAYTGTVSAITGYIEIKDAGGTIRRLAVVA